MRAGMRRVVVLHRERGVDGTAAFVAEHDEERRLQVHAGILKRAHDLRRDHVAGDAHDEQLAEARRRRSVPVARANRCSRGSSRTGSGRGEIGEDLLLDGGEARLAAHESFVARDQTREGFVCRVGWFFDDAHRFGSICS